jgi:hypothetical protein
VVRATSESIENEPGTGPWTPSRNHSENRLFRPLGGQENGVKNDVKNRSEIRDRRESL